VPTKVEQAEATRTRLLKIANSLFGTKGYEATSIEEVLDKAGVSKGALYHHFPSKEALFEAAVDADARAVIAELLGGIGESDELAAWLNLANELLDVLSRHPLARRVLAGLEPDVIDQVLEVSAFQDLRALLTDVITADQRNGRIRADLDPAKAAIGMETLTLAMTMALLQLREAPNPDREAGVAEILLAAFRPPTQ